MVVYADYEVMLVSLQSERPFFVELPQLVRLLGPEELPTFTLVLVAVNAMLLEHVINSRPGQHHLLSQERHFLS